MTYVPNPTDPTSPKDSDSVGFAAAEFRALKLYIKNSIASVLSNLVSSNQAFKDEVDTRMDAAETAVASITSEMVGQLTWIMRPTTADLAGMLFCNGRLLGQDKDAMEDGSTPASYSSNPHIAGITYKQLFVYLWDIALQARADYHGLFGTYAGLPPMVYYWNTGATRWDPFSFPDPLGADQVSGELAWLSGNYAVQIPDMRGRVVRGANPYNQADLIPAASDLATIYNLRPDYGRLIGTYQAGSLLSGDNVSGAQSATLDNVDQPGMREKLGWDKVGAVPSQDYAPYGDPDPDGLLAAEDRLRVIQAAGSVWPSSNPKVNRPLIFEKYLGVARMDNFSVPCYIRYL